MKKLKAKQVMKCSYCTLSATYKASSMVLKKAACDNHIKILQMDEREHQAFEKAQDDKAARSQR